MATIKVGRSVYKGNPLIVLDAESRYPFQFGIAKAKMILACLPEIQKFVAENTVSVAQNQAGQGSGIPAGSGVPAAATNRFHAPDVDRLYEDQCQQVTGA